MKLGEKCKNCIVKRKGHSEAFDEKKVYASVYSACASAHYEECDCETTADKVTKTIKAHVKTKKYIESKQLRKKIELELKKKDKELAFYYEQHLPDLKRL